MKKTVWMPLLKAIRSSDVSFDDKLAIAAACLEEEALMRAMILIHGKDHATAQYILHGGRFRFDANDNLCIQIPVPPPVISL